MIRHHHSSKKQLHPQQKQVKVQKKLNTGKNGNGYIIYTKTPQITPVVESSWNVMAHGSAQEGKWKENWRMDWVACTLHTTSEHGVSSITTADAHTSAASSRLNWRPRQFKWTHPSRQKTKSGFCACAITFRLAPTHPVALNPHS